jgi:putative restriction endonuclease
MLEKYLNSFSKLRTDKNRTHWSALTCGQAPHKPFLLLSVLDLVGQGSITDNLIKPSFELVETFSLYWTTIMPAGSRGLISFLFTTCEQKIFGNCCLTLDIRTSPD